MCSQYRLLFFVKESKIYLNQNSDIHEMQRPLEFQRFLLSGLVLVIYANALLHLL